jgi:hypothetical protein
MKIIVNFIIILFLTSCNFKSTEELEEIKNPNLVSLTEFGIDINGQILFEFYQHCGFRDSEEQLILITQAKSKPNNIKPFPISDTDQKKLKWINTEKFYSTEFIDYKADINDNEDIRNNGYIYNRKKNIRITTKKLFYSISASKQSEIVTIYDGNSNLLLVHFFVYLINPPVAC